MDVRSSVMGVLAVIEQGVSFGEAGRGIAAGPFGVSGIGEGGRGMAAAAATSGFGSEVMAGTLDDTFLVGSAGLPGTIPLLLG